MNGVTNTPEKLLMQKKLIVLAVAGLASTAAFAQTNVTIYGLVDYGYAYRWDDLSTADKNNLSSFNGGQASGSRLGFRGTEDLGNGLKALFTIEQGLAIDTSSDNKDNAGKSRSLNYTRQAFAGLSGGFGTLIGGRIYTPHYNLWSNTIDPFGAGTVGRYNNVIGGNLAGDVVRVDNAVAYVSPSFGGFTVTGAYSNKLEGQESVNTTTGTTNGDDTKVYALLGKYVAGGLDLGLNYHYAAFEGNSAAGSANNTYNITLGGLYNFGFMKLHGAFAYNETELNGLNYDNLEVMNYFIGATVPVGKVDLKGSILFSDASDDGDATQYAIGLNYNLSKRTDVYAAYAYIDADEERTVGNFKTSGVGDSNNDGYSYGQGFQIGLRHKF
jgi:predicted porin